MNTLPLRRTAGGIPRFLRAATAPSRAPGADDSADKHVARMKFLAEHWQSNFQGVAVSAWLADPNSLMAYGGFLGALDFMRAHVSKQAGS